MGTVAMLIKFGEFKWHSTCFVMLQQMSAGGRKRMPSYLRRQIELFGLTLVFHWNRVKAAPHIPRRNRAPRLPVLFNLSDFAAR